MSLVIEPLTEVNVSVSANKPSLAVGLVILPVAFVLGSVLPDLDSLTLSKAVSRPLSLVNCLVVQEVGTSGDQV